MARQGDAFVVSGLENIGFCHKDYKTRRSNKASLCSYGRISEDEVGDEIKPDNDSIDRRYKGS